MISLDVRQRQAEWMDEPGVDVRQLGRALRFIRGVNLLMGYTRATLNHLERFSRRWKPGQRIDIIDLATGSGDVPLAILRWAAVRGFDVHIVGVDRHAVTVQNARLAAAQAVEAPHLRCGPSRAAECDQITGIASHSASAGLSASRFQIVQADVFDLPFAPLSFDYALTSMFLHHLDDGDVVRVMRIMGSLARRGMIIADLLRHPRAYRWITLFTLLANPMIKHDARVSVAQAFTRGEILSLRDSASLRFARYHEHFGHRFVLAGEKPPHP